MGSYIKAISIYLPEKVVTNEDIALVNPEWNIHEISNHTGVLQRHVAADGETPADMAVAAAEKLFSEHGIDRNTIDFIIFCTQDNDYITPTTACILQDRLNIPQNCGSFDINQGCTGYIYGLSLAKSLIENETANNILFLTAETTIRHVYIKDKSTYPLFGDGATANLITRNDNSESDIYKFVFGTDGRGYNSIIINYYGARNQVPEEIFELTDQYGNIRLNTSFQMNGSKVFLFSIKTAPVLINNTLVKNNLRMEDINMFIFHQASKIIIETITKKLKIPEERYFLNLEKYGNTSASTIPMAIHNAHLQGKIKKGDLVMLIAFGTGFSWGATIIKY